MNEQSTIKDLIKGYFWAQPLFKHPLILKTRPWKRPVAKALPISRWRAITFCVPFGDLVGVWRTIAAYVAEAKR
jgi:hypothetical protein